MWKIFNFQFLAQRTDKIEKNDVTRGAAIFFVKRANTSFESEKIILNVRKPKIILRLTNPSSKMSKNLLWL